ncbi:hypothetical protein GGS23DRAFT_72640 [Durotheca rogersii]|uniref:uncharacterized protein n=1 Tax=Durotheca rogersii TaxID=419775 RepID=UPI00221E67A4|nr:uncharacterized protein GGS23DRAFT_72640 [Durotheca rogersii]KAI5862869.1 hypothetical protein GGS23DRAFT_72640 [Durotheca rogersii]
MAIHGLWSPPLSFVVVLFHFPPLVSLSSLTFGLGFVLLVSSFILLSLFPFTYLSYFCSFFSANPPLLPMSNHLISSSSFWSHLPTSLFAVSSPANPPPPRLWLDFIPTHSLSASTVTTRS